ncbi:MAG: molybdopterin-dependent oxidoreductase [Candidatus Bipolaricaulis sp.]|jgi:probable selenate reductase molybdenum-binding subunit|uniref:Aerobic-type carbon monoxide dehydrogenase, large subunit CoxL/CutL homologs or Aldehyde oxidase and xanthine dehydrogenase molybdopterin binding n=1 Tax=Candidatus Bipolaricaulis anaerobius TaxID=2026885 RepID=A0A2X3KKL9_9BACT|nr:molybdopterin cofactor-binding domain-containing protein [Candidatus Bipolaricaulis anaerobius]MBP7726122.1 molybdopterin-dependent oxidoreductase [Candidatus Bipolaricaulis sp.]SQD92952.1 Aerobic-type carbon monoxide dehydrogenase, large subunit CoxL/CutL homologs or Aldehyde oxidase and xanthine dehydrogenase molybdopterin binding [Candidatus Bipolaricaulis anaerobius]
MAVETQQRGAVGQSVRKVDGPSLVAGKPLFTLDLDIPGSLVGAILPSPHAHARIVSVDTSEAEQVPGVRAILHHGNVPRVPYTTAGQGWPEPSPYDTVLFDTKVRFVGDRVAAVAAETEDAAAEALAKIRVEYELLPPVLSSEEALAAGAPIIHDEPDAEGIYDAAHNIAAAVDIPIGDVAAALAAAPVTAEATCEIPYSQHATIEPHCVIAYFDDAGRLILRTSTQVPFHVRRIVARVVGLDPARIRVVKPRIGGGFGSKQEVLLEPVAALLARRTGRPVRMTYTRQEVFVASRTRHPMKVTVRLGASKDGTLHALEMGVLSNTGAYGAHALTVLSNVGSKTLPLYNKAPHVHFHGRAVYTNLPVAGAYRGYGATQGYFALEVAMDKLAEKLGLDPVELRRRNHIRVGETSPIFEKIGEGREGTAQIVRSCALEECLRIGAERIGWREKRGQRREEGPWVHGLGMACAMQGSGITGVDMAAATLVMQDDGSFRLLVGATDLGTGSDTILAQIAAQELGVPVDRVLVYSSDTDFTPFDTGAYASSTTYVSGNAVLRAASEVRAQILDVAAAALGERASALELAAGVVRSRKSGKSLTLSEVGHRATYVADQRQIAATASFACPESPPPFAAFFCEVAVDRETGVVRVERFVVAADCGVAIHPQAAEGQLEGAVLQGIGHALCEEMLFSPRGRCVNAGFFDYKIPSSLDAPEIETILVPSEEPTGPWGAKSISEVGINGPLPAISNAIYDAVGARMVRAPFTPERVRFVLGAVP